MNMRARTGLLRCALLFLAAPVLSGQPFSTDFESMPVRPLAGPIQVGGLTIWTDTGVFGSIQDVSSYGFAGIHGKALVWTERPNGGTINSGGLFVSAPVHLSRFRAHFAIRVGSQIKTVSVCPSGPFEFQGPDCSDFGSFSFSNDSSVVAEGTIDYDGSTNYRVGDTPHPFQSVSINAYHYGIDRTIVLDEIEATAAEPAPGPPYTQFTFSPVTPTVGQAVQFTDTSANSPTSWSWLFFDGNGGQQTDSRQNPTVRFSAEGYATANLTVGNASGSSSMTRYLLVLPRPPCVPDSTTLCLNGNRFSVQVQYTANGSSGIGNAVPLTSDTGNFWFFSSNNVELTVKVIDGRAFNGHFWVFFGALTDVAYTITVTDTLTGAVKTYSGQQGTQASGNDVTAF